MKKLFVIGVLLLAGCGNPYTQFYKGAPDARSWRGYEMVQGDLKIYGTNNFDRDADVLLRRGYSYIGNSSFNAATNQVSESQIREQAEKIGAHVVLISSNYTHSVSGAVPLTIPQTTTSYTTGSATAYGSGGIVNAYGSGTTTTYGSQTMMMPYSVARSDFNAMFFAKRKSRLGVFPKALDDETRRRLQTNAGISVRLVIEGSPAFAADVLPGDVILAIGNDSVQSVESFYKLLSKYEGQKPLFKIERNGKYIGKNIEILSLPKKASQ